MTKLPSLSFTMILRIHKIKFKFTYQVDFKFKSRAKKFCGQFLRAYHIILR